MRGGLYCGGRTDNIIHLTNTIISGNRSLLSNVGGAQLVGTVTITDCSITDNRAERYNYWYGGLFLSGITKLEGNTKISGNYSWYNSGVCATGTSFTMEDSVEISGNTDRGYGSLCVTGCANAYLNGGVIASNSGTGLYVRGGSNTHRVYLRGVQIHDNKGRGISIGNSARAETVVQDGTVIAGVSGVWNAVAVQEAWGKNTGAAKLPSYTCAGRQVQMASFSGCKLIGVNAYSGYPEWAVRLAEWITNEENQRLRFERRGQGPANINVANSSQVQASQAIAALLAQSEFSQIQRIGGKFWDPVSEFALNMAAGNPSGASLQAQLDRLVEGVTAR